MTMTKRKSFWVRFFDLGSCKDVWHRTLEKRFPNKKSLALLIEYMHKTESWENLAPKFGFRNGQSLVMFLRRLELNDVVSTDDAE